MTHFNPRAPCGARPMLIVLFYRPFQFQSTRPVRGATRGVGGVADGIGISIHAPRAGRDLFFGGWGFPLRGFQSTRPVRGATIGCTNTAEISTISIHAPRAGRDARQLRLDASLADFNPRAPCGARQQKYTKLLYTLLRQKAILRQFHAKRRLLKRFSTYKYRNTFLICSANRMGKICTLPLRTTRSLDLPEGMSACSQSARFCFRTFFPSSKTADYPALDP